MELITLTKRQQLFAQNNCWCSIAYGLFSVELDEGERKRNIERSRRLRICGSFAGLERRLQTNPIRRTLATERRHCGWAEYRIQQPLELRVDS